MGVVTATIDDSVEKEFRKTVNATYGSSKGQLGRAITEALKEWTQKEQRKEKRMLDLLEKGFDMGRLRHNKRDELHER